MVICCLIFSLIESQLILPAHLGNKQTKTAKGEVYLLLVPLMVIVLLQFSWSTASFVGLAIALMTVVYALDRLGLTDDPAKRLIAAQSRFSARVEALIDGPFRRIVQRATRARYTTLAMAFAFFLSGVAVFGSGRLPFSFFPPLAADQVIAQLTMPLGTSSEITEQAVRHLERTGEAIRDELNEQYGAAPPVTHILASVGGSQGGGLGPPGSGGGGASGGHMGEVTLQLTPSQSRTISTKEVAALWRERSGSIAGAVELKFNSSLFSVGNAIDIQLAGNDVDELREVAAGLRAELARYPGVIDITDSFRSGKQELKLKMTPEGEALGLSLGVLAQQVRQAFYGEEAQRIQRGRDDVRVMVRYTEAERESLASLDDMRVRTREGSEVPFRTVANASLGQGYSSIKRADRKRVVNVTADVDRTQITADEVVGDLSRSYFPVIRAEHPRVSLSLEGEQRQSGEYLVSLVFPFLIALFAIYALLAIPLRSYVKPFIIMSVIPFAFIGAIWGHQIMKLAGLVSGLAMMSILGMIAAAGVVVNSSLILVYAINQRRDAGITMADAVVDAATSRCRPIVLTSMTTFVGLMPLMFNTSVQAQFLVPMAVSLSFGVLFATVITLLVVPSIYLLFEDLFALRDRMAGDSRKASIQNAM